MAIAEHCVKLEKEGGDILKYLWEQNYLTPRATWYNIQREYLGRKRYEYTEGKPNEKRRKYMRAKVSDEDKKKAIQVAIDGGDPREFLAGFGVSDPKTMWWKIKWACRDEDPELYAKIPERLPRSNAWKNHSDIFGEKKGEKKVENVLGKPKDEFEKMTTVKVDGGLRIETPEANRVEVVETPEKTKKPKITAPVSYDGFEVTAIRDGSLGEFYYDRKYESIDWRTVGGDEVSMGPVFWRELYEKLPRIMGVLGVDL